MLELCTPIFANVKLLSFVKKILTQYYTELISWTNCSRKNQCFKCLEEGVDRTLVLVIQKGEYAIKSFVAATKALKDDLIDVLVTTHQ
jgi:4-hydroxythreonine-4-phosphate dehydrogenase